VLRLWIGIILQVIIGNLINHFNWNISPFILAPSILLQILIVNNPILAPFEYTATIATISQISGNGSATATVAFVCSNSSYPHFDILGTYHFPLSFFYYICEVTYYSDISGDINAFNLSITANFTTVGATARCELPQNGRCEVNVTFLVRAAPTMDRIVPCAFLSNLDARECQSNINKSVYLDASIPVPYL